MSTRKKAVSNSFVLTVKPKDGRDAIQYSLEVSTSQIRWGEDYAGVRWFNPASYNLRLIRYEGSTATVLSSLPSGYHLYYFAYDGNTLVDSGESALDGLYSDQEFSYVNVCNKVEYILCTDSMTPASPASAHNVIGDVVVTASRDYFRVLIPAGTYQNKLYVRDDSTTPLVYHSGLYWYLDADSNNRGTVQNPNYQAPSETSGNVWKRARNEFQVILTQMLFTEFARMGGFIVYNNFFISQYGTLVGNNIADVKVNVSNVGTQYIGTKNSQAFTSVPYGWFDGSDPMGETPTSGTTYKFRPMKVVNALTGEEWMAEGKVHVDSNGDVTMNNVEVRGSISFHKSANTAWNGNDDYEIYERIEENQDLVGVKLRLDMLVVRHFGESSGLTYTVLLPPAKLCVGVSVRIYNAGRGNGVVVADIPNGDEAVVYGGLAVDAGMSNVPVNRFYDPSVHQHMVNMAITNYAMIEFTAGYGILYDDVNFENHEHNINWMVTDFTRKQTT